MSILLQWAGPLVGPPQTAPPDLAVAPNFERFDGLEQPPLDNPAALDPMSGGSGGMGTDYGETPRPGQMNQPVGQVYNPGPISGVVGTVGGQPLPVEQWNYRGPGNYTHSKTPSVQWRLGQGQAYQGVAQTVALSEITNNPPVPGDLTSILAGFG
jgi:hypothetical protein